MVQPHQPQYGQPYPSRQASGIPAQPQQVLPPGYYPPQPPAPKRKKWPWVLAAVLGLMIAGCIGVFALFFKGADELDQNVTGKNAVAGQMNKPAVDGKFQFTVTGMRCGVPSVGPKEFGKKAQGEFCLVAVSVKNVGSTVEAFSDMSQKAYDSAGTEFSSDSGAAVYANEDHGVFLESINPGNTVKGQLVFDVPKGTKLASIILHESTFTAGIKIPLK